jgi:hypothetical protein
LYYVANYIISKAFILSPSDQGRPGGHCTTWPIILFRRLSYYPCPIKVVRAGIVLRGQTAANVAVCGLHNKNHFRGLMIS